MGAFANLMNLLGGTKRPISTKVTLAGKPMLMSRPVRWRLVEGLKPCIETFEIHPADLAFWEATIEARIAVELVFDIGTDASTIDKVPMKAWVYVTKILPDDGQLLDFAGKPVMQIEVADRRIWWDLTVTLRRYNMRRAVGTKRRRTFDDATLDVVAPDIAYAAYSLPAKTSIAGPVSEAWDVLVSIKDVLTSVDALGLDTTEIAFDAKLLGMTPRSLESVELDGETDNELGRLLSLLPEAGLFVDYDGKVVIKAKSDAGAEIAQLKLGGDGIRGGGADAYVDYKALCARTVRVYFTMQVEVRLDSVPRTGDDTKPIDEYPRLEPVVKNPWRDLEVDGVQVPEGGYVSLYRLIGSINALAKSIGSLVHLSLELLGECMVPGEGWEWLLETAGHASMVDDDHRDWQAMMHAIQRDAWQLYRIDRGFWDRCYSISDRLTSGLDQEQGMRAAAQVYANWTRYPNVQGRGAALLGSGVMSLGTTTNDYPTGPVNGLGFASLTAASRPSPFQAHIEDSEQGLIRIAPLADHAGRTASIQLGTLLDGPIYDPSKGLFSAAFGSVAFGSEDKVPRIDPASVKIAVIMSAIPAAPNGKGQLWYVDVKPSDVAAYLPDTVIDHAEKGLLAVKELRCPAAQEVARIAYSDTLAEPIARLFGIGGVEKPDQAELSAGLLNSDPTIGVPSDLSTPAASLDAIARAMAASYWHSLRGRREGGRTTVLHGEKRPLGNISEVTHTVADGVATSHISMPPRPAELSMWSFMDAATRRILLKEVDSRT